MKRNFFHEYIYVFLILFFSSCCITSCKNANVDENSSIDFGASIVTSKVIESQTACFEDGFSDLDSCADAKKFSSTRTKARSALAAQKSFFENCSEILKDVECKRILTNSYFFSEK